jgi:hypothetical protein
MSCVRFAAPLGVCLLMLSCTSSGPYGGPALGPVDNHCYLLPDGGFPGGPLSPQSVDPNVATGACVQSGDAGTGPEYGPTNYNSEANDDDCKYQVGWWSTPIQQGKVTFYVSNIFTTTGLPMDLPNAAANTIAEVYLNDTHPSPNANLQVTTEIDAGVYMIAPVEFDESGQWTVRFHFNEECLDIADDSPHGHAAFYVNVP